MTALIVMFWAMGLGIWVASRFGRSEDSSTASTEGQREAASRRRHPSGDHGIDHSLADCDPVWSVLDDRQLERLLRDAAS